MKISKLNKMLKLWVDNNLISGQQQEQIVAFMKKYQREQLFRFIKWLFIIGAFWLVFGLIALVMQILELDFFAKFVQFLSEMFSNLINLILFLWEPIRKFLYQIFGKNLPYFYGGVVSFVIAPIFIYFANKNKCVETDKLKYLTNEQKYILKGTIWLEVVGAIILSIGFMCFNHLLISDNFDYYDLDNKILPLAHIAGTVTFIILAYRQMKVSYLLFGLYFLSLCLGVYSGYGYACYFIGISRPILQILTGCGLIAVGYFTEKNYNNNYIMEKFSNTYTWFGLLTLFIALWIVSIWGFDFEKSYSFSNEVFELWSANILFIGAALASMWFGVKSENKIFFNYGLTFFIIATYTIFFSRLWANLGTAIASLLLGAMLITTGKLLIKIYKKQN